MPKLSQYAQGTPNWVDLQTTDQSAAKQFYASLLGWSYDDNPMPQGGVYSMATVNGETVAAIAPMPPGAPEGRPPMWNTYIAVDDVDAAVDNVGPAGGQVLMAPVDIGEAGRMAFVADPTGPAVGLWQANRHIGATLVGEPGAPIWNELITDKPESALAFYEAVVGLTHPLWRWHQVRNTRCSRSVETMSAVARNRRCKVCLTIGMSTSLSTMPTPQRPRRPRGAGRSWSSRSTYRRWGGRLS